MQKIDASSPPRWAPKYNNCMGQAKEAWNKKSVYERHN